MSARKLPGGEWGLEHGRTIPPLLSPFALVDNGKVRGIHAMCSMHGEQWARFFALMRKEGDVKSKVGLFLVARSDVVARARDGSRRCFRCSKVRGRNRIEDVRPRVLLEDLVLHPRGGAA